jgi:glycosidase
MLHFLENHDEQRLASKFFAGDPWKGVPAMVISATIDRGPVMIYFGQEIGEPGLGSEGFQGDDGRTTIFDYWGVPEHQKWMNGGAFDGGLLSPEQKQLRQFYIELLTLVRASSAIKQGEYIDITEANIALGKIDHKVSAFVRFDDNEKLLIVNSFNDKEKIVTVQIPDAVVDRMGLDKSADYIARDLLWREAELGVSRDFTIEVKLKPYSSFIFKLK